MLHFELHLNLGFKWASTNLVASCISPNTSICTCHVHASYCCICLCIDRQHHFFSIGSTPEGVPEYLSEESYPFVVLSGKQPPLSILINPTLSLLLLILHQDNNDSTATFLLRQLNPFLRITCHCHSKQLKPTSMSRSCLSLDVPAHPCLFSLCQLCLDLCQV